MLMRRVLFTQHATQTAQAVWLYKVQCRGNGSDSAFEVLTLASSSTAKGAESRMTLLTRRVQSIPACDSARASLAVRGASAPIDPSPPRPSIPRSSAACSSRSTRPDAAPASSVGGMKATGCKQYSYQSHLACAQERASWASLAMQGSLCPDQLAPRKHPQQVAEASIVPLILSRLYHDCRVQSKQFDSSA